MTEGNNRTTIKSADFQRRALRLIHGGIFILLILIVAEYYKALGWKISLVAIIVTSLIMIRQYRYKMARIRRFEEEQINIRASQPSSGESK